MPLKMAALCLDESQINSGHSAIAALTVSRRISADAYKRDLFGISRLL
jgi:hypothetical protein